MINGIIHNALSGGGSGIIIPDRLAAIADGDFSKTLITVDAGNYTYKINLFYCDGSSWTPVTDPEHGVLPGYAIELDGAGNRYDVTKIAKSLNKGIEYWAVCYKGSVPLYAQNIGKMCEYSDHADWALIYPEDGSPRSEVHPFWTEKYEIDWGTVSGGGGGITWNTLDGGSEVYCDGFTVRTIACGGAYTHTKYAYIPNEDPHIVGHMEVESSTRSGIVGTTMISNKYISTNLSDATETLTVKALGVNWLTELDSIRWSIARQLGLSAQKGNQRQWLN